MEGKASAALSIIIIILGIVMTSSRSSSSMTSRSSSSSSGLIGVGWQNRGRLDLGLGGRIEEDLARLLVIGSHHVRRMMLIK